jgi:phage repressor protein C with HTH and peptisase S24 domain
MMLFTELWTFFLDKTNNPGSDKLDKILTVYPDLNLYWLITGKGDKEVSQKIAPISASIVAPNDKKNNAPANFEGPKIVTIDRAGKENILFVPIKAAAGYLNGYADPEYIETLPAYRIPGFENGTFRMFEVKGDSMEPTLSEKDKVIGRWVDINDIKDSYLHIIVTKERGAVVKRVLNRLKSDGVLVLKSDGNRKLYPDIIVEPDDVLECWRGAGYFSKNLAGPHELYTRLDDVEGRLAIVDDYKQRLEAIEKLLKGK